MTRGGAATVAGDPAGYELAWDEGRSGIAVQTESLRDLRDRAGTLVTLTGVVLGLALSLALDGDRGQRLDELGVLGLGAAVLAFAVLVVAAVQIWRPFPGRFVRDPSVIVDEYVEGEDPLPVAAIHRELALWLAADLRQLVDNMETRTRWFTVGLIAVLLVHGGLAAMILDVAR